MPTRPPSSWRTQQRSVRSSELNVPLLLLCQWKPVQLLLVPWIRGTDTRKGLDLIGLTLKRRDDILGFQSRDRGLRPWIWSI